MVGNIWAAVFLCMCVRVIQKVHYISTVYKPEVSKKTNCSVVGCLWEILPVVPVDKMIYYSVFTDVNNFTFISLDYAQKYF
jgi:hypothetical protein